MRPVFSDKRFPPYAVCTVCGHYAYCVMEIYQRCSRVVDKKRCKGRYGPALMRDDWKECPDCGRTGRVATGKCGKCAGVGWLYVNSHPKPKQKDQAVQPDLFHNFKTGLRSNHGKG
jgi:hypothetical protein